MSDLNRKLRMTFQRHANKPVGGAPNLGLSTLIRKQPGIASGGINLPFITNGREWLRSGGGHIGLIPRQIAKKLRDRPFANFDEFREAFWKEVINDPILKRDFTMHNPGQMAKGKAPGGPGACMNFITLNQSSMEAHYTTWTTSQ